MGEKKNKRWGGYLAWKEWPTGLVVDWWQSRWWAVLAVRGRIRRNNQRGWSYCCYHCWRRKRLKWWQLSVC
jgi:hypothetical protein